MNTLDQKIIDDLKMILLKLAIHYPDPESVFRTLHEEAVEELTSETRASHIRLALVEPPEE